MRRRAVLALMVGAVAWPVALRAQNRTEQRRRIGFLRASAPQEREARSFLNGLAEHGWFEGQNLQIDWRYADGASERLPALAFELVAPQPDVIVVDGGLAARAAGAASPAIPIVFTVVGDAVASGFTASLSRPGGQFTGQTNLSPEIVVKRVETLREMVPSAVHLILLRQPANEGLNLSLARVTATAERLGMQARFLEADNPAELEAGLRQLSRQDADALPSLNSPLFYAQRVRIVEAVAAAGFPALYPEREFVEAGGLMSYGINVPPQWRGTASYVDRILRGAKPGELSIEQPSKLELVVRLKAAKALDLKPPETLLLQADEMLE